MIGDELRKRENLIRRWKILQGIRRFFQEEGFVEVETPLLVQSPGLEPHLSALEVCFTLPDGIRRNCYLHTSPEYAMKKLLAQGWERIFQICRVFRDGELGPTHQVEFTMLEWYRAGADYRKIMDDCENLILSLTQTLQWSPSLHYQGRLLDLRPPYERITVAEAMARYGRCDIIQNPDGPSLLAEARSKGYRFDRREHYTFEDVFFKVFLEAVEPQLGWPRPTILYDYPGCMAALARLKPGEGRWAERFELYIAGLELANAFSELNDPVEQRRRFMEDQKLRGRLGRPVYPMDEELLCALGRMPPCAGIALGVDRLVMLFCDARTIEEVVAFPLKT